MPRQQKRKLRETPDELINEVLSEEFVSGVMNENGYSLRGGLFHPALVAWLMMYQRICELSLSEILEELRGGAGGVLNARSVGSLSEASLSTGGISQARTRLPDASADKMVDAINESIIRSHQEHLWEGKSVFMLDGTDFRVLADGDLKKEFPPCRDAKRRSAWSIIRSVIATHLTTGVALRPAIGPMYGKHAVGEVSLAKDVIGRLPPHSVVIADMGLGTFSVAYTAVSQGHQVLLRLTKARAQQACGKKLLKDQDFDCAWQPAENTLKSHSEIQEDARINGRIIRYTLNSKGLKPTELYIFTTLHEPIEKIIELYGLRWNVETDFRTIKTAMKMECLDVQSASMARKEIAFGIAAYNMVRHLLAFAAHAANIPPRQVSFTRYAYRVRAIGNRLALATTDKRERARLLEMLTDRIHQITIPKRRKPRLTEPRKILRKPRPFPYLRNPRKQERIKLN